MDFKGNSTLHLRIPEIGAQCGCASQSCTVTKIIMVEFALLCAMIGIETNMVSIQNIFSY